MLTVLPNSTSVPAVLFRLEKTFWMPWKQAKNLMSWLLEEEPLELELLLMHRREVRKFNFSAMGSVYLHITLLVTIPLDCFWPFSLIYILSSSLRFPYRPYCPLRTPFSCSAPVDENLLGLSRRGRGQLAEVRASLSPFLSSQDQWCWSYVLEGWLHSMIYFEHSSS